MKWNGVKQTNVAIRRVSVVTPKSRSRISWYLLVTICAESPLFLQFILLKHIHTGKIGKLGWIFGTCTADKFRTGPGEGEMSMADGIYVKAYRDSHSLKVHSY